MHARRFLALTAVAAIAISACAPAATTAPTDTGAPPTAGPSPTEATAEGPNAELTAALAGEYDGKLIDFAGQWIGADGEAFNESLDAFRDATGINVVFSGISNYETVLSVRVDGGLAPDIAQLAQPGRLKAFAADGKLVDLDTVLDGDAVRENYSPGFITDGSGEDGKLYGLYYQQNLKSIVWYPVKAFEAAGYTVPETWDDLEALVEQIKADGGAPWCTSIEHAAFSGWVATDWLEDVLLRTAPVETYDKWAAHELPFTDPAVVKALEFVGSMWFTDGNSYGGAERINGTWVGDSQTPMFDDPPKCWLHKQAAWIPDFWPEGTHPTADDPDAEWASEFFYFPGIEEEFGNPVLGASDMFVMFNDRPEVRALLQWFTTPESVQSRIETGGFLSANLSIPADWYDTYPMSGLAEIARNATVSRADAVDGMSPEAQTVVNAAMVKWVSQNGEGTEEILAGIEADWPE